MNVLINILGFSNSINWQWISLSLVFAIIIGAFVLRILLKRHDRTILSLNGELKKQNAELDYLLEEKDKLMGILSHDVRSPMSSIKTVSEFIDFEKNPNIDRDTKDLIQEMKNVSERGLRLVDNIWTIYEFEHHERSARLSTFRLKEIFNRIANEFGKTAVKHDSTLTISPTELELNTDEELLLSVVTNLISNALKFSPTGSKVELFAEEKRDCYNITVRDNGPGFTPTDKKDLFKKFQSLSGQPQHGEKSSGFGLYLVKVICDKLNISIQLISEYKKGAEFVLSIPKTNNW